MQDRLPLLSSEIKGWWKWSRARTTRSEQGTRNEGMTKKRQTRHIYLRSLDRFLFSAVPGVLCKQRKTNLTFKQMCVKTSYALKCNNKCVKPTPDTVCVTQQRNFTRVGGGKKTMYFSPSSDYLYQCFSNVNLISFSPPSFYLLHLSLCTPGRGSGAFCLVMWAELWDALHGAALNIAAQLRTSLPVKKLHRAISHEISSKRLEISHRNNTTDTYPPTFYL